MVVDFIGLGAQKSGTSWVYACLYEHPEVCAPVKELHFFSRERFSNGKDWYESHFRRCAPEKRSGEFSTSYLYSPEAPARIKEYYPNAKLIAILRNPITRAYSQYRNAIKAGEVSKGTSFETYREQEPSCIEQGRYVEQLERYYRYFSKEQILVCLYEDIDADKLAFIQSIYRFLDVDATFVPTMLYTRVNTARTPRVVWVDRLMHRTAEFLRRIGLDALVFFVKKSGVTDTIRNINTGAGPKEGPSASQDLKGYFRDDVIRLSALIGRDLSKEWNI
ncbi:sulfotransferase domain-containing protein [Candidatus Kaiserbacteria bacterium]|nr:sulfotransferase domain-containing protein [Candidatus Kaiserbacteria bacterium]